ncbi:MAG TPA: hypothetical protein VFB73_11715 [Chloroflexota bacterium]|nr:hypothetical protein [Chloroflexota bacterium]
MSKGAPRVPPLAWRNRIVGYGAEAPDQLVANPRNWRIHPTAQQEALLGVLREVGIVQDVLVNRTTGFVVDGHLRVLLALRDGQATIPVKYVELTPAEEALVLATFDPLAALAGIDQEQLGALLQEVQTSDAAVQQLLNDLAAEAGVQAPDVEFPEYDEDAADDVAWLECPACGHRWPK